MKDTCDDLQAVCNTMLHLLQQQEQRINRRQERAARRLALGGIAPALLEGGVDELPFDHEAVTLQRLESNLRKQPWRWSLTEAERSKKEE